MQTFFYITITILGLSSYAIGAWKMLRNQYAPSTFSRVVWVLLAINSFFGVWLSQSTQASILLAGILLIGNITICILSFSKGTREMGRLEYICLGLLAISGFIWIFYNAPYVNLILSLVTHFIGAAPTYKKVWRDPKSESIGFWCLFFLASLLSIFVSPGFTFKTSILPIYFTLFDGSLLLLSLRRYRKQSSKIVYSS